MHCQETFRPSCYVSPGLGLDNFLWGLVTGQLVQGTTSKAQRGDNPLNPRGVLNFLLSAD